MTSLRGHRRCLLKLVFGVQASLFEKPVNLEAAKASHSEFRYAYQRIGRSFYQMHCRKSQPRLPTWTKAAVVSDLLQLAEENESRHRGPAPLHT